MRAFALVLASTFASACVTTEMPVVQACRTPGSTGPVPSEGSFTILPSRVPGVEITHASWRVRGTGSDLVPVEDLWLSTTVHAERTVAQEEIAVVYDAPGPHAVVDAVLLEEGVDQYNLGRTKPFLEAGGRKTVGHARQLRSSHWIGRNSALTYCPRTVRLVPRREIALALAPELTTPQGQAARLRGRAGPSTAPLTVLMDTVVQDGAGAGLVIGAALNTTDSTLSDMVVGLGFSVDTVAPTYEDAARRADTLEYHVRAVAPHAVIPFAGGWLMGSERITRRVVYQPTDVSGREIAGVREMNRASNAAREGRARAGKQVECPAQSSTCAK